MNIDTTDEEQWIGWPWADAPSEEEAQAIRSTFAELGMHEPDITDRDSRRGWYLAGQIVARISNDRRLSPPKEGT